MHAQESLLYTYEVDKEFVFFRKFSRDSCNVFLKFPNEIHIF